MTHIVFYSSTVLFEDIFRYICFDVHLVAVAIMGPIQMNVSTLVRDILGKYLKFNSVVTVFVLKCVFGVCFCMSLCCGGSSSSG